jgi:NAD+ diphosphatase
MDNITPSRPNAYTGGSLDRAAHHREDDEWVAAALADPASRFAVFLQGRTLISGMAQHAPRAALTGKPDIGAAFIFLGLQHGTPIFAASLDSMEELAGEIQADAAFTDMRGITGDLTPDDATILATARAMLHWHAKTGFCAVCGGKNKPAKAGWVMLCTQCGEEHFPRTDPAVIMLVARGNKLLLGQSHKFPKERTFYSTLAGFVEPGESLEDAVRREVFEETGIRAGAVRYHSSQPWPFPASLMLGYYAEALNEEIVLDTVEMRDARWFTCADIENRKSLGFNLPPHDSIARRLIDDWLNTQESDGLAAPAQSAGAA